MADGTDKTTEDLEREITCPVCHEHFEDPRILPCAHYYCKKCVQALADRAGTNQSFPCPECRKGTRLPQNDPSELPKALSVIRIKDLHTKLVQENRPLHKMCSKHNDHLKLYCDNCNCLICGQCAVFDHTTHSCKLVNEITPQLRELLCKKIAPLKTTRESYSDATDRAKAMISEIEAQNTDTTGAINQWVERYVEIIRKCGRNFIEDVKNSSNRKIDNLKFQIKEFDAASAVIQSVEERCEHNLNTRKVTDEAFLDIHKQMLSRVEDECRKHKDANLELAEQCKKLKWTENLALHCQKGAPIVAVAQLANVSPLVVGKRAKVSINVLAADGTPCKQPQVVDGGLNSLVDGSLTRIKGTHKKDGTYEMVFTPQIRGRHQLAVTVNGEQVDGSPFTMCVQIPPTQLGTPVRVISGLHLSYGIAFNSAEEILITMAKEIRVFDNHRKKLQKMKRTFQNRRTSHALTDPNGIAVDKEDNVFVADSCEHRVYKLDKYGNQIKVIGMHGIIGHSVFNGPAGLAVAGDYVFVCDRDNHRIQMFNRELEFVKSIGSRGTGNREFQYVYDLCQDEAGNLYVCDYGNDRIQVLNSNGEFLSSFGTKGKGKGQLSGPAGVCVSDQFVYVSECSNDRVSVFDRNGRFVISFVTEGSAEGCFSSPLVLRVDKDGFVHVCDHGNNRVQIF